MKLTKEALFTYLKDKIDGYETTAQMNWEHGTTATAIAFEHKANELEDLIGELDGMFDD